jgi:hypothetical protein
MSGQNEINKETIVIKTLKCVSLLVSFAVIILLLYHFMYAYTPYLKNAFYGYANFEDFLYRFPHETQNSLTMIIFGNFRVFFLADSFFIIAGIIFILSIESGLLLNKLIKPFLEDKKREVKK